MIVRATRRDVLRYGSAAAAAALVPTPSIAQAWPAKPIRIICGYPAGGLTDSFARAYGEAISQKTGQPVFVENKAGASGIIAAEMVKAAAPDGYTLMWTISTTMIMNKVLFKKLPDVPTFLEQGVNDITFQLQGGIMLVGPAGLPKDIVVKLSDMMVEAGKSERIQKILDTFGIDTAAQDHVFFERFMAEQGPQWVALVKSLNIEPQ